MNAVNQVYFSKRAQGGSATFAQRSLNKMGVMAMILGLLLSAFFRYLLQRPESSFIYSRPNLITGKTKL